jgi:trk system potassium uptake protein TrkA
MKKQFLVVGCGDFGKRISIELESHGADVLLVERDMEIVEAMKDRVSSAMCLDASKIESLDPLDVPSMDAAITTMGAHFEETVLTTTNLLELGAKRVVVRASTTKQKEILLKLGAHEVFNPEYQMAERLAKKLSTIGALDVVPVGDEYVISEVIAPKRFAGKTLAELRLREKFGVNLITILRTIVSENDDGSGREPSRQIVGVPAADTKIIESDALFLLGKESDIEDLID